MRNKAISYETFALNSSIAKVKKSGRLTEPTGLLIKKTLTYGNKVIRFCNPGATRPLELK
jgi:hypothetical protein